MRLPAREDDELRLAPELRDDERLLEGADERGAEARGADDLGAEALGADDLRVGALCRNEGAEARGAGALWRTDGVDGRGAVVLAAGVLRRNEGVEALGAEDLGVDDRGVDEVDDDAVGARCGKDLVLPDRGAVVRAAGLTRCCAAWDRLLRKDELFAVFDGLAAVEGRVWFVVFRVLDARSLSVLFLNLISARESFGRAWF